MLLIFKFGNFKFYLNDNFVNNLKKLECLQIFTFLEFKMIWRSPYRKIISIEKNDQNVKILVNESVILLSDTGVFATIFENILRISTKFIREIIFNTNIFSTKFLFTLIIFDTDFLYFYTIFLIQIFFDTKICNTMFFSIFLTPLLKKWNTKKIRYFEFLREFFLWELIGGTDTF